MEDSKLKKKEYNPALGDVVKIKRDIYSDRVEGMFGQIVLMFANGDGIALLLRIEKNYGWDIESNKNNLPGLFYAQYSKNKNYNFWWVDSDDVEFIRHSKVIIDNQKKMYNKKLLKALKTISQYCCQVSCCSCEMRKICDKCQDSKVPFFQIADSLKELEEQEN